MRAGFRPIEFKPLGRYENPAPAVPRSTAEIRDMVEYLESVNRAIKNKSCIDMPGEVLHNEVLLCALRWTLGAPTIEMGRENG